MFHLRDLSELQLRPSGGDPHVTEYPGVRVLWRRSPGSDGYTHAGYGPELAAFRDLVNGETPHRLQTLVSIEPIPRHSASSLSLDDRRDVVSWPP